MIRKLYFCIMSVLIIGLVAFMGINLSPQPTTNTPKSHTPTQIQGRAMAEYVDPDSGVHYLIHRTSRGQSITARLNPDGSPMKD